MKRLMAAVAFCSVIALPALAQSYDPDIGSGNIAPPIYAPAAPHQVYLGAHVRNGRHHARHRHAGRGTARGAFAAVPPSGAPIGTRAGSTRESALRECSAAASRYTEHTWGDMEIHQFRTCMAVHGQPE
jgi:hypothetical protein